MSEPEHDRRDAPWTESGDDPGQDARLELRPGTGRTGSVDGAWWPRSRDLRAELPALLTAVDARLGEQTGRVSRVSFGVDQWEPDARYRIVTPTGRVTVGGYKSFTQDVVWVASRSTARSPLTLVVVPPETSHDRATAILRRASVADGTETSAELLAAADEAPATGAGAPAPALAHAGSTT